MADLEIPASHWLQFCEDFTRRHHGWQVGMRQIDTRELAQGVASAHEGIRLFPGNRPFQEVREGANDDHAEVMVTVGEGLDETSFLIEDAVALFHRKAGEADQGLRVDSDSGITTLIEFRSPAVR